VQPLNNRDKAGTCWRSFHLKEEKPTEKAIRRHSGHKHVWSPKVCQVGGFHPSSHKGRRSLRRFKKKNGEASSRRLDNSPCEIGKRMRRAISNSKLNPDRQPVENHLSQRSGEAPNGAGAEQRRKNTVRLEREKKGIQYQSYVHSRGRTVLPGVGE